MHLSEETSLVVERAGKPLAPGEPSQWQTIKLGVIPRLGFVLRPGNAVVIPPTVARSGDYCLITLGPTHEAGADGLDLEVRWRFARAATPTTARELVLFRAKLGEFNRDEPWVSYQFSLEPAAGSTGSIVLALMPGRFWRRMSEIAVYELVISDAACLDLERARSFRSLRIRNEQANFDAYYQHAAFRPKEDAKPVQTNNDPKNNQPACHPDSSSLPSPMDAQAGTQRKLESWIHRRSDGCCDGKSMLCLRRVRLAITQRFVCCRYVAAPPALRPIWCAMFHTMASV